MVLLAVELLVEVSAWYGVRGASRRSGGRIPSGAGSYTRAARVGPGTAGYLNSSGRCRTRESGDTARSGPRLCPLDGVRVRAWRVTEQFSS